MYKLSSVHVLWHNRGVAHRFSTNDQEDVEKLQEIRNQVFVYVSGGCNGSL